MREQIPLERLTGLVAFARAGTMGSYTAAARSLGISPSAVSKSVQRLERHLGLSLFTRTTRSLVLTAEGRALHSRALALLRGAEEIELAARAVLDEPSGNLKIAATLPLAVHVIAPSLPRFRERFPRVSVELRASDYFIDLVEEGIDVALWYGEIANSRLVCRTMAPHRFGAYASPAYLERHGTPAHPDDLAEHEIIGMRRRSSGRVSLWSFCIDDQTYEIDLPSTVVVDSKDALVAMLAAGGGIGMTSAFIVAAQVRRGELVPVLDQYSVVLNKVRAVWPASRGENPAVKAFIEHIQGVLGGVTGGFIN